MQTPAGAECPYYYEDFHRGRSTQECRLIQRNPRSEAWEPRVCSLCPVPTMLRANTCPNMVLEATIERRWFGQSRRVRVRGFCSEYRVEVEDPFVGCGHCHPGAASVLNSAQVED
jgi:hypothetical protein